MDYKWIGLEQKWIGSKKLDFLPTPSHKILTYGMTMILIWNLTVILACHVILTLSRVIIMDCHVDKVFKIKKIQKKNKKSYKMIQNCCCLASVNNLYDIL